MNIHQAIKELQDDEIEFEPRDFPCETPINRQAMASILNAAISGQLVPTSERLDKDENLIWYVWLDEIAGWLSSPLPVNGATKVVHADRAQEALNKACELATHWRKKYYKTIGDRSKRLKSYAKRIAELEALIDEYEDEKAHQDFMKRIG